MVTDTAAAVAAAMAPDAVVPTMTPEAFESVAEALPTALTVVPLDALKKLLSEAQAVSQASTGPNDNDVSRLRNAGKAFDDACRELGYAGSAFSGSYLPNVSKSLYEVVKVQCSQGNYDCSPYMLGLTNGLILAQSIVMNDEPEFMDAPAVWLDSKFMAGTDAATVGLSVTVAEVNGEECLAVTGHESAEVTPEEDHY